MGRIDTGASFCSGTLIAPDLVLTAAHCLFDSESGQPFDLAEMEFHQAIPQRLLTASHLSGKAEEMPSTGQDDALSAQRLQDWTRDDAFKCNDQVLKVCNYDILTEASTVAARFIMLP